MFHFIFWLIGAAIGGFIASKIVNKTGSGLFMDLVLGIVGGMLGGWIVSLIPGLESALPAQGLLHFAVDIAIAAIGAVIVLFIYHKVFKRTA
jgi:uncharacterized membrane protein YeaQ/YmgE (transglycosylase-associated protein family)